MLIAMQQTSYAMPEGERFHKGSEGSKFAKTASTNATTSTGSILDDWCRAARPRVFGRRIFSSAYSTPGAASRGRIKSSLFAAKKFTYTKNSRPTHCQQGRLAAPTPQQSKPNSSQQYPPTPPLQGGARQGLRVAVWGLMVAVWGLMGRLASKVRP